MSLPTSPNDNLAEPANSGKGDEQTQASIVSIEADPSEVIEPDAHLNDDLFATFFNSTSTADIPADFKCGFVAIVGRPNVGKSTLMNHILGQKLSITSRKPQTTRHKIVGIDTKDNVQIVFVDTPGMHKQEVRKINKMMNRAAVSALRDVNVVLFVVDGMKWVPDDQLVLDKLVDASIPVILVINKIDHVPNKTVLLPYIEQISGKMKFSEIVPVAALHGTNLDGLRKAIAAFLPYAPPLYAQDQLTDRSERFLASEMIREKIMRMLGDEIPYDLTVQIETFKEEPAHTDEKTKKTKAACTFIDATIFVERVGQKVIVIGDKGQKLKKIGMEARRDMETMFEKKVMLTLWVKVKGGWSDDERALKKALAIATFNYA